MTDLHTKIAKFVDNVLNNEAWASTGDEAADHILKLIAEHQPKPRVFFPGDLVPAGMKVIDAHGAVLGDHRSDWAYYAVSGGGPAVEVFAPSSTEYDAVVARARAEREDKQ